MNSEKTLAELSQGATGIATLRVGDLWMKGIVFENGEEKYFGFFLPEHIHEPKYGDRIDRKPCFAIRRFRILNNGVKVGSEVLAISAAELKQLLGEAI